MAESDRLLSDCTPFKGVPRVQIPLSPPVFYNCFGRVNVLIAVAINESIKSAPMAQLDRASDYESGCRRFESSWARH